MHSDGEILDAIQIVVEPCGVEKRSNISQHCSFTVIHDDSPSRLLVSPPFVEINELFRVICVSSLVLRICFNLLVSKLLAVKVDEMPKS